MRKYRIIFAFGKSVLWAAVFWTILKIWWVAPIVFVVNFLVDYWLMYRLDRRIHS